MELIPEITDDTSVPPVLTMPLTFVVGLSMIKDAYEDIMRHRSDREENNRVVKAIPIENGQGRNRHASSVNNAQVHAGTHLESQASDSIGPIDSSGKEIKQYKDKAWHSLQVGQIIKVHEGEYFPCDMLLIKSSLPKGVCYVETKNLDGETNLKHKQASKNISKHADSIIDGNKIARITCEKENESIYTFQGVLEFVDREGRNLPPSAANDDK